VNGTIGKNFPVKTLGRVPGDKGLKSIVFTTGFVVLKGKNKKAAVDFINLVMTPENNARYNAAIGTVPSNRRAQVPEKMDFLKFSDEEDKQFAYHADWAYVSDHLDSWVKRWEAD